MKLYASFFDQSSEISSVRLSVLSFSCHSIRSTQSKQLICSAVGGGFRGWREAS
jgi:hypothetical protein